MSTSPRSSSADSLDSLGSFASMKLPKRARQHRNRVVIKVGTNSIVDSDTHTFRLGTLAQIVETVHELRESLGYDVVIVCSGAIGVGNMQREIYELHHQAETRRRERIERRKREYQSEKSDSQIDFSQSTPRVTIAGRQALAAIGQVRIMRQFDDLFAAKQMACAQVLLTSSNFCDREPYSNAVRTFQQLLEFGAVPIVNENDTVCVDELRYGDNDNLSAYVANMVDAKYLFLMTDVDGLFTANPRTDPDAKLIPVVTNMNDLASDIAEGCGSAFSTGGMATKLEAAKVATSCGVQTVIMSANKMSRIPAAVSDPGLQVGTRFLPPISYLLCERKRWILSTKVQGRLLIDDGAVRVLQEKRTPLFAVGVRSVRGQFSQGDLVSICDLNNEEIGRGLVNYDFSSLKQVCGKRSSDINEILCESRTKTDVIDRDNIVLMVSSG